MSFKTTAFFLFLLLVTPTAGLAFPSNNWQQISGDSFTVSYNEKTEHLAQLALNIAEETGSSIADFFGYDISKKKIAIVLKDHNDFSNGAAYRHLPLITIECRKTDRFWRDETDWLRNVIIHELSHIYSLRIIQLPILLSAGISTYSESNEQKARMSVNFEHNRIPVWFVEGVAQLGSYHSKADFHGPLRKMLLRDAFLNDTLLSLEQMSRFEGTSRDYELAYNQGFDLLLYLNKTYPEIELKPLCRSITYLGFEKAIQKHYRRFIEALYNEWRDSLSDRYPQKAKQIDGRRMFDKQNGIMNTEIMSVEDGRFVIANWRHDYNRFDLMIMDDQLSQVENVIEDVGVVLRRDRITGKIWFNKEIFNYQTGVSNYDIYNRNSLGEINRVTQGARCLAFDVLDNHLIFASYKNGTTDIILKKPDGQTQTLKSFSYETAVYSISMITPKSALISFGSGKRRKVGILKEESFEVLWKGVTADILDSVYAGNNRLLFVSTLNQTPQLYWVDIKKDPNIWHQVTEVAGGVRFPTVEQQFNPVIVSCSVFENGNHFIYKLHTPFPDNKPINITPLPVSPIHVLGEETPQYSILTKSDAFYKNFISRTPSFYLFLNRENLQLSNDVNGKNSLFTSGAITSIQNPHKSFELGIDGSFDFPIGYQTVSSPSPAYLIWSSVDVWQLKLSEKIRSFNYITEYESEYEYVSRQDNFTSFQSQAAYQIFKYDWVNISFENARITRESILRYKNPVYTYPENNENSLKINENTIYKRTTWSLDWKHFSYRSRFDPGGIGQPYFSINSGFDHIGSEYPNQSTFSPIYYLAEKNSLSKVRFDISGRKMAYKSRVSYKLGLDGFAYLIKLYPGKNRPYPYMYETVGRESLFSGYSSNLKVVKLIRTTGEIRLNPYISILTKIAKYERMHIGIKIESGFVQYYGDVMRSLFLTSIEGAFRYTFYLWPNQKSNFFIKYAIPVTEVNQDDHRIYLGITM